MYTIIISDLDKSLAHAIAIGDTDPITREPFNLNDIIMAKSTTPLRSFLTPRGSPRKSTGLLKLSKTLSPRKSATKTKTATSNISFGSKTTQKLLRRSSLTYSQESTTVKPTILSQLKVKSTPLFQRRLPQRTLPDDEMANKLETESIPISKTTTTSPYFTTTSNNSNSSSSSNNTKKKSLTLLRTLSVEEFLASANTAITASPSPACTALSSPTKSTSATPSLETDPSSSPSSLTTTTTTNTAALSPLSSHTANNIDLTSDITPTTPKRTSPKCSSRTPQSISDTIDDKENTPPSLSLSPSVQRRHRITTALNNTNRSVTIPRKSILIQSNGN
ncbi:hypothetical protein BDF22DRAFT_668386 [Syncephalis plumigaleata]|nr:hypothetical protein BDF22DRAFT_668386 [Syncephalis plumigaleata]